jgi:hypothetical protein
MLSKAFYSPAKDDVLLQKIKFTPLKIFLKER